MAPDAAGKDVDFLGCHLDGLAVAQVDWIRGFLLMSAFALKFLSGMAVLFCYEALGC